MTTRYCETFVVEGRYPFPMDMLRYDRCYPADTESALAIANSNDPSIDLPRGERYRVKLVSAIPKFLGPTEGRWTSFLWRVTEVNDRSVDEYLHRCTL